MTLKTKPTFKKVKESHFCAIYTRASVRPSKYLYEQRKQLVDEHSLSMITYSSLLHRLQGWYLQGAVGRNTTMM